MQPAVNIERSFIAHITLRFSLVTLLKKLCKACFLSESLSAMAKAPGGYRLLNGHRYPRPDKPRLKRLRISELCSMVRNDRFKMSVDSLTREPLDLYDMEEDPTEIRNLVQEPAYRAIRAELSENHLDRLLDKLDQTKVKKYQDTIVADPRRRGWQALEKPPSHNT